MPSVSFTTQRRVGRFRDQRWLLDAVIKLIGPEFDQSRLQYYSAPMSPDHRGSVLGLNAVIHRWDDLTREFARLARRHELQAESSLALGHMITAGDGFFAAATMHGAAQWLLFENTALNLTLESKKIHCFEQYIPFADHRIEAIEIPYAAQTVPGYLHFPPGYDGGALPCLVMVSGMDAFKEMQINASADRFLRRGFACLMLDGPGQGTCLTRGIWYKPDRYGELASAAFDAMAARSEIDSDRIMLWGLSFGSFWATQLAAAEPRFAACPVMYTCFQPHNWPLLEMASPSFRQRFLYMCGLDDEADLDDVMARMDISALSPKLHMPCFVMAGEDDTLSDFASTINHLNAVPGAKTLVVYAGEEHGMGGSRSSQLGSPFFPIIADWLVDRAAGKPIASSYNVVDTLGQMHSEPWGDRRAYDYGAPLGIEQLFAGTPHAGIA